MVYTEKQPHWLHREKIEVLEALAGESGKLALIGFEQEETGTCPSESSLCLGEYCKGHQ